MTRIEFNQSISSAKFRWAKDGVHAYTIRKTWDRDDFEECVQFITDNGYYKQWARWTYIYYDLNGFRYWSLAEDGYNWKKPSLRTMPVINRAFNNNYLTDYDTIVKGYGKLYNTPEYHKEDKALMKLIGPLQGAVLDVGCGNGLLLEHYACGDYTGIDPSVGMLYELARRHKENGAQTYNSTLDDFEAVKKYDNVLCLFSGGYIHNLEKAFEIWRGTGTLFIMFEKETYTPVAHSILGIKDPIIKRTKKEIQALYPAVELIDFNNNWIIKI